MRCVRKVLHCIGYLRNEFNFWNVHCSDVLQSMQESRSIHDSMNIPKIKFIAYIYILT